MNFKGLCRFSLFSFLTLIGFSFSPTQASAETHYRLRLQPKMLGACAKYFEIDAIPPVDPNDRGGNIFEIKRVPEGKMCVMQVRATFLRVEGTKEVSLGPVPNLEISLRRQYRRPADFVPNRTYRNGMVSKGKTNVHGIARIAFRWGESPCGYSAEADYVYRGAGNGVTATIWSKSLMNASSDESYICSPL